MSGIIKKKHSISVEGSVPEILTDVSIVTQAVYEAFVDNGIPSEEAKEMIDEAVELGMSTQAEIKKRVKEKLAELMSLFDEGEDDETRNTSEEGTADISK